ncbi:MAG: hypothetical protein WKF59_26955 [Chitinophagaceae bacterium]
MKAISVLPVLLFIVSSVMGQEMKTVKQKLKFTSVNQVGVVSGSSGESWLIQTINGIKKDKWGTGIGVGVDFYVERGVPLFLDIRRDLLNKKILLLFMLMEAPIFNGLTLLKKNGEWR